MVAGEEKKTQALDVFNHSVKKSDLFKLCGLLFFLALTGAIVAILWPSLSLVFEPDGIDQFIENIRSKGAVGVLILLGLQLVQIIVAFIPGEIVQIAAGMLYGPFFGTLIVLSGCILSSAFIYAIVKRLGSPFVHSMFNEEHTEKIKKFEDSGKLNVIVFVLFLIPGMPKDLLTYVIPLTNMRISTFLLLITLGRIPGVILSTYASAGLANGDIKTSLIIFGIAVVLVILGMLFKNKILAVFQNNKKKIGQIRTLA